MSETKVDKENYKHSCSMCGEKYRTEKSFFSASVPIYQSDHRLPVCKFCANELFRNLIGKYKGDCRRAVKRFCMMFDLYYSENIYNTAMDKSNNVALGNYLRLLNMTQYSGKSFEDTLKDGFSMVEDLSQKKMDDESESFTIKEYVITRDDLIRWGEGLEAVDYKTMNDHYKFLKDANPNCDSNQEIFISDLCYTKMQQMRAVRLGRTDDYNKLTESYRKTFQQAGLKTTRDSSATEDFSLGVNIEMIERYTPAEYYKDKKLYEDFDGIGDYIRRFLLRPLRNLMHGTTDRDHEFYVRDEEDVDVYEE